MGRAICRDQSNQKNWFTKIGKTWKKLVTLKLEKLVRFNLTALKDREILEGLRVPYCMLIILRGQFLLECLFN